MSKPHGIIVFGANGSGKSTIARELANILNFKHGDMYEQHLKFVDFAASRSLSRIEQWGETLVCPVIRIDGTENWHTNVAKIAEQYLLNE